VPEAGGGDVSVEAADIVSIATDVWETMLGLELNPEPDGIDELTAGPTFDGIVTIAGDWHGAVVVQVSRTLALRIARILFGGGDSMPTPEDMQDAVGEITNMTGGNIKGLLPGDCHLSLPTVVEGSDYRLRTPGAEVVRQVAFTCGGQAAVVRMIAARPDRAGAVA
jgi:CheY-specific phosphatase CheX